MRKKRQMQLRGTYSIVYSVGSCRLIINDEHDRTTSSFLFLQMSWIYAALLFKIRMHFFDDWDRNLLI